MRNLTVILGMLTFLALIASLSATNKPLTYSFPSYNPNFPPPPGYPNPFSLSQDYPSNYDQGTVYPWQTIDFKQDPISYIETVLKYCLEGNTDVDFVVQNNTIRKWYHVPWLHDDSRKAGNGREYIHGLTRERATPIKELSNGQKVPLENWAIGFYNIPGGYTIGKIWANGTPSVQGNEFPEGTCTFKLLFTDATTDKVPFLTGTKEWTANIYPCDPVKCPSRTNRTVRLLQIDIAVKDKRSTKTGWVFGTYIYDGSNNGATVWDRMVPVGLSWGDDSDVSDMINTSGSFLNPKLTETFLNSTLILPANGGENGNKAFMKHFGLGGRLNGPVDNPISSCISCHGRAANLQNGQAASTGNFSSTIAAYSLKDFKTYFSTVPPGNGNLDQNRKAFVQTDYSLQLATGIRNFYQHRYVNSTAQPHELRAIKKQKTAPVPNLPLITRGGN